MSDLQILKNMLSKAKVDIFLCEFKFEVKSNTTSLLLDNNNFSCQFIFDEEENLKDIQIGYTTIF